MGTHREILHRHRVPIALVTANLAFASLFMTLALSAFHQPAPHDLKVGVVGPAPVTRALQRTLDVAAPGGFELREYRSESQARAGIDDRRLDDALVTARAGSRLLVADAGGSGGGSSPHRGVHRGRGQDRPASGGGRRRPARLTGTLRGCPRSS